MTNRPIYYKDLISLGSQESPVSIVTLWTICDKITKDIDKKLYCLAGQLYTKNGINYLVRNLLANKNIRYLVLVGQDGSGAGQELKDLWQNKNSQYLHKEIKKESLNNLLNNVKLVDLIGIENSKKIKNEIKKLNQNLGSYGKNEKFKEPEIKELSELECSWPTDISVFKVKDKTIAAAWLKALKTTLRFGDIKITDAMRMKEILNLAAVITEEDPNNFYLPPWLGLSKKKVEEYLPQIIKEEKNPGLHYTYGNRLQKHFKVNQIKEIISRLKKDKNAREAIAILFDPAIDHRAKHRPCIILVQALRNQGVLNFNAYIRSHDIFGGWPLNAFSLRKLQKIICQKTKIPIGSLTIFSASAHIYDFNWEQALKIIKNNFHYKFEDDERGFFKIEINKEKKEIIVEHFNPDGHLLETYIQDINIENPINKLIKKINENLGVSLISHAIYLGAEFKKAEIAIKLNLKYTQDKPLKFNN